MSLYLFYTMVQKSKNDQKLQSRWGGGGGSCLNMAQQEPKESLKKKEVVKFFIFMMHMCMPKTIVMSDEIGDPKSHTLTLHIAFTQVNIDLSNGTGVNSKPWWQIRCLSNYLKWMVISSWLLHRVPSSSGEAHVSAPFALLHCWICTWWTSWFSSLGYGSSTKSQVVPQ